MRNPILDPLNDAQRRAVTTVEGPVLVLAGPGSGKTRVLTHRIAYMIQDKGIKPWNIVAVTFTNKAAGEMKERIGRIAGEEAVRDLWLGTFHAFCARVLRREVEATPYKPNFLIYDTSDQQALVKNIINEMQKDPKQHRPGAILGAISAAKNELITPEEYPANSYREQVTQEVYRRYMRKLQANNAMDFDDLLTQTVYLLQQNEEVRERYQNRLQYIMVDEFQDTNMAQFELVRILAKPQNNLFVVGDPDQSIYAFRGADYRNVYRFREEYPDHRLITLDENYRSHQLILDAAMSIIRKDPGHIKRDLFSSRSHGPKIEIRELHNEREEGTYIVDKILQLRKEEGYVPRDFAIMYRTNAQSRAVEDSFIAANVPYRIVGGIRFYERMEIKDLLAYLRLIQNPDDSISLARVINVPARSIGKKTIESLQNWVADRGDDQAGVLADLAMGKADPFTSRASGALQDFAQRLIKWRELSLRPDVSSLEVLDAVIEDIGYIEYIETRPGEKDPQERVENINELRRTAASYEGFTLDEMMAEISLVADIDQVNEQVDAPTLMTLHSAKGLEFPVVFLVGLEEGLMPHERSKEDASQMAEERRLMYVGITRAKDRLYLLHTSMRSSYGGGPDYRDPSRFLDDLPEDIINRHSPWAQRHTQQGAKELTKWSVVRKKEETPSKIQARFKTGTVVKHRIFGRGIVLSSKSSADMEEVLVKFDQGGLKKLDGSYLELM